MVNFKHIKFQMDAECPKCYGEGELDWVENVVGKRKSIRRIYFAGGSTIKFPANVILKLSGGKKK